MRFRHWLLTIALVGTLTYCERRDAFSSTSPAPALASYQFAGAASCAASACHNGYSSPSSPHKEYTTWITRDAHARGYEVLFEKSSRQIQKYRHQTIPAHEDQRCLGCHVAPEFDVKNPPVAAPYFKTDGVSCESCHGPATAWLPLHYQETWRAKTSAEKKRLGMNDTQSLRGRAQICATCHVGQLGMNVDHDLIAAGHPRLNFEFTAFHAALPHHWPDAKDCGPAVVVSRGGPDFEARAWVMGQLVTAEVSLRLVAARADNAKTPWPEFAEYDCAACHHPLTSPSKYPLDYGKRKPNDRKAGTLPWGNYVVIVDRLQALPAFADSELAEKLKAVHATFDSGKPNRPSIVANARQAAVILQTQQGELLRQRFDQKSIRGLLETILPDLPANEKDSRTQIHLGAAALHLAGIQMQIETAPHLQNRLLETLSKVGKANRYDPHAIQQRLTELQNLGSLKGR